MLDPDLLPPKTQEMWKHERDGWRRTSESYTHAWYRRGKQAACIPYNPSENIVYWEVKEWMQSNYR